MKYFLGIRVKEFGTNKLGFVRSFEYTTGRLYKRTMIRSNVIFENDVDNLTVLNFEDRILKFPWNCENENFVRKIVDDLNSTENSGSIEYMYELYRLCEPSEIKAGKRS